MIPYLKAALLLSLLILLWFALRTLYRRIQCRRSRHQWGHHDFETRTQQCEYCGQVEAMPPPIQFPTLKDQIEWLLEKNAQEREYLEGLLQRLR